MKRMKHQAILGNIGHFDNEIDMAGLERRSGAHRLNVKPQVDEWTFEDGHSIIVLSEGRLLNLGNATGHPSFVMSNSFSNQVIAQIELFTRHREYNREVYTLPKVLDEKVARIHVEALSGNSLNCPKNRPNISAWTSRARTNHHTTGTKSWHSPTLLRARAAPLRLLAEVGAAMGVRPHLLEVRWRRCDEG